MVDLKANNGSDRGQGQVARLSDPHMDELMRLAARLPRHGLIRLVERAAFLVEQTTEAGGQVIPFRRAMRREEDCNG